MNIDEIAEQFDSFLGRHWAHGDIHPFLRVFVRLLLRFETELTPVELRITLQRQRQLQGQEYTDEGFDRIAKSACANMLRDAGDDTEYRACLLQRILFCSLLDTHQSDVYYLTEPLFEFIEEMGLPASEACEILVSEFRGFRVTSAA